MILLSQTNRDRDASQKSRSVISCNQISPSEFQGIVRIRLNQWFCSLFFRCCVLSPITFSKHIHLLNFHIYVVRMILVLFLYLYNKNGIEHVSTRLHSSIRTVCAVKLSVFK